MTTCQPGDLVLVAFPFTGGAKAKQRPAWVILATGDSDVVVARVTTQPHQTSHDVAINDWQAAGLLAPSVVRLHKLATLEQSLIRRTLGHVKPADRARIASVLRQTFDQ